MAVPSLQIGDLVAGKYRIERLIGEGGMAQVFAARHQSLDQLVAIKVLLPSVAGPQALARFRREARAAASIRGEHVCRVLDVGELSGDTLFMVMEYLEGDDLSQVLEKEGPLSPRRAATHVLQACEALAEAHQVGIVHRDLKPGNLFLARGPSGNTTIKVLDFGVSKLMDGVASRGMSLTSTAMLVGSPLYMSPEQVDSARDVDAQTDIWALGVVLYELVTRQVPFTGDSMPQFVHALLSKEPPSFESLGVSAPAGFEDVVLRALRKDKQQRYATVADLASALATYAEEGVRSSALRAASFIPPAEEPGSRAAFSPNGSSVATPVRWEREGAAAPALPVLGGRLGGFSLGLATLVIVGGGIIYWSDTQSERGDEVVGAPAATAAPEASLHAATEPNVDPGSMVTAVEPALPDAGVADEIAASPEHPSADAPEGALAEDDSSEAAAVSAPKKERRPPRTPIARARSTRVPRPSKPASASAIVSPEPGPTPAATEVKTEEKPAEADLLPDFGGRK